jgi:L-alanine-DL-glutamate epimerase-like enolase superfamily enzyme
VYSAVDIALWDIAGQAQGKPIHALLGGGRSPGVRAYASGGSAALDPAKVAADAGDAIAAGHAAFKMRVGFQDWETDLARVAAARERLGNRTLMVDAIMGTIRPPWDAALAARRIRDLERFGLAWIEEPLHPDDVEGMSGLRAQSAVPVAAGEALTGHLDYAAYFATRAVHIIQVDVTHCGGITVAKRIVEKADALGLKVAMHVWGSAAAHAANAHLAFAHPAVEWLEAPMVAFELSRGMGASAAPLSAGGMACAPEGAGLGVKLGDELKSRYPLVPGSGYRL